MPGSTATSVTGVALDGTAVGNTIVGGQYPSFLRGKNGKFRVFQVPKALGARVAQTYATGINSEAGLIVGYYYDPQGMVHGFAYRFRAAPKNVPATSDAIGVPPIESVEAETIDAAAAGSSHTYVTGVNSSGVLSGWWAGSRLAFGFIATPVKAPSGP